MSFVKLISKIIIFSISLFILTGCVHHLSQNECQNMDWKELGFADGNDGKFQRNLSGYIKDCAEFKIAVDTDLYARGWNNGVRSFCRPEVAYQLGASGKKYNHICPRDLAGSFQRGWQDGLREYCIPATGYTLGRSGKSMPEFCAADLRVRFKNAYMEGRDVYRVISGLEQEIEAAKNKLSRIERRIEAKRRDIASWQKVLDSASDSKLLGAKHKSSGLSRDARRHIRDDYAAIELMQMDLDRVTRHIDRLRSQLLEERSRH